MSKRTDCTPSDHEAWAEVATAHAARADRLTAALEQIAHARKDMTISIHRESWAFTDEYVHLLPDEWADLDAAIAEAIAADEGPNRSAPTEGRP